MLGLHLHLQVVIRASSAVQAWNPSESGFSFRKLLLDEDYAPQPLVEAQKAQATADSYPHLRLLLLTYCCLNSLNNLLLETVTVYFLLELLELPQQLATLELAVCN